MTKPALIEITPQGFGVEIALAYATADNFTSKPVYAENARCFLHPQAANMLREAVKLAKIQGYGIKIFDAFRPTQAQWKLWEHTPDPDFLADPNRGSPHSRGVAIDLTLLDARGKELDMGTIFDAFTPLSHHGNTEISTLAQRNRLLLMGIMSTAGWDFYRNEWWHYQLFNSRDYALYDDGDCSAPMMR
jgi:D-alanyl-D-alanine dipeptidase